MAEANGRPEIIHHQIAVASRITDKTQSKILANEYIDLGTLLHRTSPSGSKCNFVVQTTHSADWPVISLEPFQKTKRITTIDQWTFVAIYTVQFPNDALASMKYSQTVRDLAAKNVRWRYYEAINTFPPGPDPLGTVVAGTPHAKTGSCCFVGRTQQKFKTALSARLLLEISLRGKMFRLQL